MTHVTVNLQKTRVKYDKGFLFSNFKVIDYKNIYIILLYLYLNFIGS